MVDVFLMFVVVVLVVYVCVVLFDLVLKY